MKKTKIKKSMLAIPEPLWQCLHSSLLYKLSPPFWIPPLLFLSPPFHSSVGVFFSKPTLHFLFITSASMGLQPPSWLPTSLAVSMKLFSFQKRDPPILPKKRKAHFSRVVAAKIKIIPLVLQGGVYRFLFHNETKQNIFFLF